MSSGFHFNETANTEIYTYVHTLSLHAALPISSVNKTFDVLEGSISSLFTTVINTYRQIFDFGGPIPLVPLGDSVSLNSQTGLPGTFRDKLNENSTSWMLGVNYKATPTLLLYANVSKGYKAGSFPGVSAGTFAQYAAV